MEGKLYYQEGIILYLIFVCAKESWEKSSEARQQLDAGVPPIWAEWTLEKGVSNYPTKIHKVGLAQSSMVFDSSSSNSSLDTRNTTITFAMAKQLSSNITKLGRVPAAFKTIFRHTGATQHTLTILPQLNCYTNCSSATICSTSAIYLCSYFALLKMPGHP